MIDSIDTLTIDIYNSELQALAAELDRREFEPARARARRLLAARVAHAGETVATDRTILAPLADGKGPVAPPLRRRLDTLVASLGSGTSVSRSPDAGVLSRVRGEQALDALPEGSLGGASLTDQPLVARIAAAIVAAAEWVLARLGDFLRWLIGLLPARARGGAGNLRTLLWVVGGILLAVVVGLVIVAVNAWRHRQVPVAAPEAVPGPVRLAADEDPLSRSANEWQRYAAELSRAGRLREAVRACYHAVLVTCYAAGVLHHRKGRTNWEHVSGLSPSVAWRPRFAELTRQFERRWYGMVATPPEEFAWFESETRVILDAARAGRVT